MMKFARVRTWRAGLMVVSLSFVADVTEAEEALAAGGARVQLSEGPRFIKFADDRLTVKVQGAPLSEVLEEISRQSGFRLVLSGPLEDRLTLEFQQLPLDGGLRRILRQHSFAVEYARPTNKERLLSLRRPKTLWIFPKSGQDRSGQPLVIGGRKLWSSGDDATLGSRIWQAALKSPDASDREEAVEALGESGHPDVVPFLRFALQDNDEDVREAAIVALVEIGGDEAARALVLALRDENASIREEAVEALEEIGGAEAVKALALALQDEDASVREEAVEALGAIGGELVVHLLEQALVGGDETMRDAAAEALVRLRH